MKWLNIVYYDNLFCDIIFLLLDVLLTNLMQHCFYQCVLYQVRINGD